MNLPDEIITSEETEFTLLRGVVIVPIGIVGFGFVLAMLTSRAALTDLIIPFVGAGVVWLVWVGILWLISRGQQLAEKRTVQRMFAGEIWESWQFSALEWQRLVEAESNLISPKEEGAKAYSGVIASSIFGAVLALILLLVVQFAIKDPEVRPIMRITAGAIFLLLVGIGFFQPLFARYQAQRYERRALRVGAPRVWFAAEGLYHETLGYLSLKDLEKVTDQTRSRQAILFTLTYSTDTSDSSVAYPVPVPAGCEDRAGRLVRRYREERLN